MAAACSSDGSDCEVAHESQSLTPDRAPAAEPEYSSGGDDFASVSAKGSQRCHLCRKPCQASGRSRLAGVIFHPDECWPAVRCYRRMLSGKQKEEADTEMLENPSAWRSQVLPLKTGSTENPSRSGQRSAAARRHVETLIQSKEIFHREETRDTTLVLNKRRYKSFSKMWDGLSSDEASSEFEKLHHEQRGKGDKGNVKRVYVEGNTELVNSRGEETRDIENVGKRREDREGRSPRRHRAHERERSRGQRSRSSRRRRCSRSEPRQRRSADALVPRKTLMVSPRLKRKMTFDGESNNCSSDDEGNQAASTASTRLPSTSIAASRASDGAASSASSRK